MRASAVSIISQEIPSTGSGHVNLFAFSTFRTLIDEKLHEGQVYADAKTYILLEIKLMRPLVAKRPAAIIAERYFNVNIHYHTHYLF